MTQDIEAIQCILRGDIQAFEFILKRYERPVIRMIRNITQNQESCEDIAQDVFLTAYEKLSSFDVARSEFSTWLFTIAINKSKNALKKKKVLALSELPEKTDCRDSSENIMQEEFFVKLDKKLQTLPQRQKRAFVLAELENLPYEQIAQIEGVRIGTVKSRINRAKKKLQIVLKSLAGDIL